MISWCQTKILAILEMEIIKGKNTSKYFWHSRTIDPGMERGGNTDYNSLTFRKLVAHRVLKTLIFVFVHMYVCVCTWCMYIHIHVCVHTCGHVCACMWTPNVSPGCYSQELSESISQCLIGLELTKYSRPTTEPRGPAQSTSLALALEHRCACPLSYCLCGSEGTSSVLCVHITSEVSFPAM